MRQFIVYLLVLFGASLTGQAELKDMLAKELCTCILDVEGEKTKSRPIFCLTRVAVKHREAIESAWGLSAGRSADRDSLLTLLLDDIVETCPDLRSYQLRGIPEFKWSDQLAKAGFTYTFPNLAQIKVDEEARQPVVSEVGNLRIFKGQLLDLTPTGILALQGEGGTVLLWLPEKLREFGPWAIGGQYSLVCQLEVSKEEDRLHWKVLGKE